MNNALLAIRFGLNAVGIASAIGLFCPRGSTLRKVSGAILCLWLLAFAGFCTFGFLASFEPPVDVHRPWQIGYAIAGVGALAGILLTLRHAIRKAPPARGTMEPPGKADRC